MRRPLGNALCWAGLAALLVSCAQPDIALPPPGPHVAVAPALDQDHVATRVLEPVITLGWTTEMQDLEADERQSPGSRPPEAFGREAWLNAQGLTAEAYYRHRGLSVDVEGTDLLYPSVHQQMDAAGWALLGDHKHIVLEVWIDAGISGARIAVPERGLITDCGPGVAIGPDGLPRYRRIDFTVGTGFRSEPTPDPQVHGRRRFALMIEADPRTVTHCTLHLADAITERFRAQVPDLPLRAVAGAHDTRVFLIRNAVPRRAVAAR